MLLSGRGRRLFLTSKVLDKICRSVIFAGTCLLHGCIYDLNIMTLKFAFVSLKLARLAHKNLGSGKVRRNQLQALFSWNLLDLDHRLS